MITLRLSNRDYDVLVRVLKHTSNRRAVEVKEANVKRQARLILNKLENGNRI